MLFLKNVITLTKHWKFWCTDYHLFAWGYPNLGKKSGYIENDYCTIEYNWNIIDRDSFETEVRNLWARETDFGHWPRMYRILEEDARILETKRVSSKYCLNNWPQSKPNRLRPFSTWTLELGRELSLKFPTGSKFHVRTCYERTAKVYTHFRIFLHETQFVSRYICASHTSISIYTIEIKISSKIV